MTPRPSSTTSALRSRAVAVARLLVTAAALVAGQAALWRAGAVLPSLPLHRADAARTFAEAEPLALAVAAVRLVALGVGAALLLGTALGITARCCGAARLVVHVDRWTPAGLRRLLDGALGVGLAASIGLVAAPAGADDRPPAEATTIHRPSDAQATTLRRLPDAAPADGGTPTGPSLRRLPDAPPAPSPSPIPTPPGHPPPGGVAATVPAAPAPAPATGAGPPAAPAAAGAATPSTPRPSTDAEVPTTPTAPTAGGTEVVVRPGESFWRLAEQHEAGRLGRRPTEAEIGACWQELVAVNRHRLVVPDDPDLLFPGQRLILPCP